MVSDRDEEPPMTQAAARPTAEPEPDLEQVFRRHAPAILAAAFRVTGSAQDAEDVLQTVFLRLVRREGGPGLGEHPSSYLHRAAINAGLDILRSRQAARATPLADVEGALAVPEQHSPANIQGAQELRDRIRQVLATLSPRSAEMFVLRYFEGHDNHEIAAMLGTSRSTVGVILHRTRGQLREAIGDRAGDR
jgi:RNA polymerase sigma-70 factor (ECF subfamily)